MLIPQDIVEDVKRHAHNLTSRFDLEEFYGAVPNGTDDYARFLFSAAPSYELAIQIDADRAREGSEYILAWDEVAE